MQYRMDMSGNSGNQRFDLRIRRRERWACEVSHRLKGGQHLPPHLLESGRAQWSIEDGLRRTE